MCDRSKWQALEETVVSGSGSSSDNGNKKQYKKHYRRPQIWWIVYKPLGVGIQTSRKSFLDSGKAKDNFGKPPTCCNRFCRQTDYHLSRIEMSYEKSLSVQPFQIVDMAVCSFLCCTRADLKPNCNRATYLLRTLCCSIMLFLLGIGMCLFVIIVNNSGVITSINVGAIIFEIIFWPLIVSLILFAFTFVCNCFYLRLETYPTRFYNSWQMLMKTPSTKSFTHGDELDVTGDDRVIDRESCRHTMFESDNPHDLLTHEETGNDASEKLETLEIELSGAALEVGKHRGDA